MCSSFDGHAEKAHADDVNVVLSPTPAQKNLGHSRAVEVFGGEQCRSAFLGSVRCKQSQATQKRVRQNPKMGQKYLTAGVKGELKRSH